MTSRRAPVVAFALAWLGCAPPAAAAGRPRALLAPRRSHPLLVTRLPASGVVRARRGP